MEIIKPVEWEAYSPAERNISLEAFYHAPFIPLGGVIENMDFDMASSQSPLLQLLAGAERRDHSLFGKAILNRLQSLLNYASHTSPEFRIWLREDYTETRKLGFAIEEKFYGAPWIDPKGMDGIFSNDREYVRWVEEQSHREVYKIRGLSISEYEEIRSKVFGDQEPRKFSQADIALANWRTVLIENGEIEDSELVSSI